MRRPRLRFDRGTIVLDHLQGGESLPGVLWDPRVGSHRAPAWRYRELKAALAAVEHDDDLTPSLEESARLRPVHLRHYQGAALADWELCGRRGVVVLPTGAGKTHLALSAIERLGLATLVLVPTRALLAHWLGCAAGQVVGPVGVVGDGECSLHPVTICTFESAYGQMDRLGQRFGLLVVDEVHHLGGRLRPEVLEMCAAPNRLGLTATPPSGHEASELLERLLGPVVSCHTVADLSGSYLAPHRLVPVVVQLSDEERQAYEGAFSRYLKGRDQSCRLGGRGRESRRDLQRSRHILATARAKVPVVERLLDRHRQERCLIFTSDNRAAYGLSRTLLVPAVTCDIRRPEREALLDGLRVGRYRALISARVLNEGLDLPECGVGIVVGQSEGSIRERWQRLGRILRPVPGKTAVLYQVVAAGTVEARDAV